LPMARVIALSMHIPQRLPLADVPRAMIVIGCAMALILAGKPLPF